MDYHMYHYAPVSIALQELQKKGYLIDYNLEEEKIISSPEDFVIEQIYRYEGATDPGDEATVYGICNTAGEKGFFLEGLSSKNGSKATMIINELFLRGKQTPHK